MATLISQGTSCIMAAPPQPSHASQIRGTAPRVPEFLISALLLTRRILQSRLMHPGRRRSEVGMTMHCMRSYTLLVIKTCHKRGVHAMGGMAAHIPIRDDPAANQVPLLAGSEGELVAESGAQR